MKKYFLLLLLAFFVMSCSKKVEIKGKISGASPLERIEIIEGSGVATLPLVNMGVSSTGDFSGSFDAPKDGMYAITFGRNMNMIYLKKGQSINISGTAADFPAKFTMTGDGKNNNDFLLAAQKYFTDYTSKLNVGELITKNEAEFLKAVDKLQADLGKNIDDLAKKNSADNSVVEWKKDELNAKILGLLGAYKLNHGQATGDVAFKVSNNFNAYEKKLVSDNDKMVRELPVYRDYVLGNLNNDLQKFIQSQNPGPDALLGDLFSKFLANRKDVSQVTKDYLLAYVIAQSDLNPMNSAKYDQISKMIDGNIKDAEVKDGLKKLQATVMGMKNGSEIPSANLISAEGKSVSLSDLKGKPTLVTFYASWSPGLSQMTVPVLKQVVEFYKSKMNFAYIDFDDTKEQFQKTSKASFSGIAGSHFYAEGGLNSDFAKKFNIYGFKLPSFILLDKDGKVASRPFFNLGDPEFVTVMDKLSGLKAPMVPAQQQQMPVPAPQPQPQKK